MGRYRGLMSDQILTVTLRSTDWAKSRAFYEQLGFEVSYINQFGEDAPVYANVRGFGCIVDISEHRNDCEPGGMVGIRVPDVDAAFRAMQTAGVQADPPREMPWGDRSFMVHDPDGNSITFWTPTDIPHSGR